MSLRKSFVAVLSLISSVALSWSALAAPTSAAPALKKNYTSGITPPSATANTSTPFTFTITNSPRSQQTLGSANIIVPSSFRSVSTGAVTPTPGWFVPSGGVFVVTSPYPGTLVELRSDNQSGLAAGQSATVVITAKPGCPDGETWHTYVKQSNDFSGTGNDFTNSGTDPSVTVTGCPDHLAITQQPSPDATHPANVSAGAPITPAIKVEVQDSSNNLIPTANVEITMAIDTNGGCPSDCGTLYGTMTLHTTSDGTATGTPQGWASFSMLVIDKAGDGYTLTASSSGLTSATTYPFNVTGIAVPCADQSPCNTPPAAEPNGGDSTTGSLSVATDLSKTCPDAASCFLSLDTDGILGSTVNFCGGQHCIGDVIFFNTPANATAGRANAFASWDKTVSGKKGAAQFNVYEQIGTVTTQRFACTNPNPAPDDPDCVLQKYRTGVGDLVIVVSFKIAGDPRWGTN